MRINWSKIPDALAQLGAFIVFLVLWCSFLAVVVAPQLTFWPMARQDVGWALLAFACIIVCGFAALPMWQAQRALFRFFTGK